ncbi:hypothetical protein KW787_00020 [Candidatus Pacearchaeota archaeon]|nr:hypothetical protein [Candidatus Pacearchaeota archaeon]
MISPPVCVSLSSPEKNRDKELYALISSGASVVCLDSEEYVVSEQSLGKLNEHKINYEIIAEKDLGKRKTSLPFTCYLDIPASDKEISKYRIVKNDLQKMFGEVSIRFNGKNNSFVYSMSASKSKKETEFFDKYKKKLNDLFGQELSVTWVEKSWV